jgi:pimeloyl-ACP methyl ester carboxylesterase
MLRGRWWAAPGIAKGPTLLRWSAVATALMLCLGLATVPAAQAAPPPAPVTPGITWTTCSEPWLFYSDLQCGKLVVPLDHANPSGPKIKLALTRRLHTAAFKGVLLTNPGGPGGSDLTMPALTDYVPQNAGAGYDWIGFDPRGVGASTPSLHCNRGYFGYDRPGYTPTKRWISRFWLKKDSRYASACADTTAKRGLLPHLTTLDTVKDMDSIRVALGMQKISFYGYSYGTYLGQVYATRYPSRVDKFVLDGVVNPTRVWYGANQDQDRAFEANMDVYWRFLAAHPQDFHLGKRWRAIKRGYFKTLRRLDRHPAAAGRVGPDELADVMLDAGYYVFQWAELGKDYSSLVHRQGAAGILNRYRQSQTGDDNAFAMYNATQCTDVAWPGQARTLRDARALSRKAPFLTWSNTWYNAPCLTWHAPSRTRPPVTGRAVSAKILLINETRDAPRHGSR